jgi:hypothetical protein
MVFNLIKKDSLSFLLLNYSKSIGEQLEYKDKTWWITGFIRQKDIEESLKAMLPITHLESLSISYLDILVYNHGAPTLIHNTRVDSKDVLIEPDKWLNQYQIFIKDKYKHNLFNQLK